MKTAEINGKPAFIYESKGAVASAGADKISITHDTEDGYVSTRIRRVQSREH